MIISYTSKRKIAIYRDIFFVHKKTYNIIIFSESGIILILSNNKMYRKEMNLF